MDAASFAIGIAIGAGLAFGYIGVVLLLMESQSSGPFEDATVEDFLPRTEGG